MELSHGDWYKKGKHLVVTGLVSILDRKTV